MTTLLYMPNREYRRSHRTDHLVEYGDPNDWTDPSNWGTRAESGDADDGTKNEKGGDFQMVHINDFTSEEIKVRISQAALV